ncbi:Ubiquitin carboxyl-terminal hydrolase 48 [Podila clonocystis]|nr:Ubiquitin carboxyl-terminal hydrolase 48 [Podila clonocystis]
MYEDPEGKKELSKATGCSAARYALVRYLSLADDKPNPETSKRSEGRPAGMKNLGATCYANSLLQVWFHDSEFRNAIYSCEFEPSGDKDIYNPLALVNSLKLDISMQQDAQEFCNLFMARIDNQLQRQKSETLQNFIKSRFQGRYSYNTTCKNCKNTSVRDCNFFELMLNIKDYCTLMDCFDEFVETEELSGNDKYSCSKCDSLQDAVREIKIEQMPEVEKYSRCHLCSYLGFIFVFGSTISNAAYCQVLNVQLMRFVYDNVTWTKRKSKDMIRFPELIDFASLLRSKEPILYELTDVLVHNGPSAHSGHFLAHVLDKKSKKWFVLNDEEVAEFNATLFDPEAYSSASKGKKASKTTMDPSYYVPSDGLAEQIAMTPLSTETSANIEGSRLAIDNKLYGIHHRRDVDEFEKRSKAARSTMAAWISKSWLNDWLKMSPHLHAPHSSNSDDPSPASGPFLGDALCPHSNLAGDKTKRKLINKSALEVLTRIFGPLELPGADAEECCQCLYELQPHLDSQKDMTNRAASEKIELSRLAMRNGQPPMMQDREQYYILPNGFLRQWLDYIKKPLQKERPAEIVNDLLLCEHGGFLFNPDDTTDAENNDAYSVITADEWAYLQAMVLNFESAPLFIRIYSPGDSIVGEATMPTSTITPGPDVGHALGERSSNTGKQKRTAPKSDSYGSRRSKRAKPEKEPFKQVVVYVGKGDTVRDLKLKIMQKTRIVPIYQKLLLGQQELDNNEITMAGLEILPSTILNLIAFDQSMESLHLNSLEDIVPQPGDVGGFGGTGLVDDEDEWA